MTLNFQCKLVFPDAPIVEQEQTYIHTREHDETEVVCVVHASPRAAVRWYKNGRIMDSDQVRELRTVRAAKKMLICIFNFFDVFSKITAIQ